MVGRGLISADPLREIEDDIKEFVPSRYVMTQKFFHVKRHEEFLQDTVAYSTIDPRDKEIHTLLTSKFLHVRHNCSDPEYVTSMVAMIVDRLHDDKFSMVLTCTDEQRIERLRSELAENLQLFNRIPADIAKHAAQKSAKTIVTLEGNHEHDVLICNTTETDRDLDLRDVADAWTARDCGNHQVIIVGNESLMNNENVPSPLIAADDGQTGFIYAYTSSHARNLAQSGLITGMEDPALDVDVMNLVFLLKKEENEWDFVCGTCEESGHIYWTACLQRALRLRFCQESSHVSQPQNGIDHILIDRDRTLESDDMKFDLLDIAKGGSGLMEKDVITAILTSCPREKSFDLIPDDPACVWAPFSRNLLCFVKPETHNAVTFFLCLQRDAIIRNTPDDLKEEVYDFLDIDWGQVWPYNFLRLMDLVYKVSPHDVSSWTALQQDWTDKGWAQVLVLLLLHVEHRARFAISV